ncbi:hypothetical protein HAX54_030475, partial [Datura stramonium]|nr:hypothetical protein [Datura stramonium]
MTRPALVILRCPLPPPRCCSLVPVGFRNRKAPRPIEMMRPAFVVLRCPLPPPHCYSLVPVGFRNRK